jgi:hypothetical protein
MIKGLSHHVWPQNPVSKNMVSRASDLIGWEWSPHLGMVAHSSNPRTQEAEAGGSWIPRQLQLCRETLSHKKIQNPKPKTPPEWESGIYELWSLSPGDWSDSTVNLAATYEIILFFFFVVLGLELRTYTTSHSTSPLFVMSLGLENDLPELASPQFSRSLPPE